MGREYARGWTGSISAGDFGSVGEHGGLKFRRGTLPHAQEELSNLKSPENHEFVGVS
jgi:hypothetical protein